MAKEESVDEIVKTAQAARRKLSDFEHKLQTEIDDIDFAAFQEDRKLTPAESARREQLRDSQSKVREAFVELAFVTVSRLDQSDEVKALSTKMDEINRGLSVDLDRLKNVVKFAKTIANVADGVAKVAALLANLAAM